MGNSESNAVAQDDINTQAQRDSYERRHATLVRRPSFLNEWKEKRSSEQERLLAVERKSDENRMAKEASDNTNPTILGCVARRLMTNTAAIRRNVAYYLQTRSSAIEKHRGGREIDFMMKDIFRVMVEPSMPLFPFNHLDQEAMPFNSMGKHMALEMFGHSPDLTLTGDIDEQIELRPVLSEFESNTMKLGERISEGTYGRVFKVAINDQPFVAKFAKPVLDKWEVFNEGINHVMFSCRSFELHYERYLNETGFAGLDHTAFTNIVGVMRMGNEERNALVLILEKMEGSLWAFIKDNSISGESIVDVILQVLLMLASLQEGIGFFHRDLHLGNILYRKRPAPVQVTYAVPGQGSVSVTSRYQAYISDLGTTCATMPAGVVFAGQRAFLGAASAVSPHIRTKCANRLQDVAMFLGAVHVALRDRRQSIDDRRLLALKMQVLRPLYGQVFQSLHVLPRNENKLYYRLAYDFEDNNIDDARWHAAAAWGKVARTLPGYVE